MNQAHLHLLTNHLPIIGSILGGLVLTHGLWTKSNQTIIAAYNLLIISAIGAVVAYLTGEPAEDAVENIAGVSKNLIEQHEDFAMIALIALIVMGVCSLTGIILILKKSALSGKVAIFTLIVSLISFVLVARTGYIGGQIRHTEINSSSTTMPEQGGGQEQDD